jgi:hypothetical protein
MSTPRGGEVHAEATARGVLEELERHLRQGDGVQQDSPHSAKDAISED